MNKVEFHPLANIFPVMSAEEYVALRDDIAANGLREPITTANGKIIDGRNRYNACIELGIEPRYEQWDGIGSLLAFIVSMNLHRRHLNESQRAMARAKVERLIRLGHGGDRRSEIFQVANWQLEKEAARTEFSASDRSTARAHKVLDEGTPELIESVEQGQVAVSLAATVATWQENDQSTFADDVKMGTKPTKAMRKIQQRKQQEEANATLDNIADLASDGDLYRAIIIDPPWPIQKILRDVRPNQDVMDYKTMSIEEIAKLPIKNLADSTGCHIYLWFTHKHLPDALWLFQQWGVEYQCIMTWIKNVGFTPFSWMYSTEHVLFGRIGSLTIQRKGMRLDFSAKVREHSRKPDKFYERVIQASPEPRLDLFSREKRDGFDQWGDEGDKFSG